MVKREGVEKRHEKDIKEEARVEKPKENKITIEEFMVNFPSEKMWVDGLKSHAGLEPKTLSEWKRVLEDFKNKPTT